jgi:hypothetical protein
MNNNEQFDQFFNQQLNAYTPDVPLDAWDKLVAAQKKDKPKVIAWWFNKYTMLLMLAIASGTAGILLTNKKISTISNTKSQLNKNVVEKNNNKQLQINNTAVVNNTQQVATLNKKIQTLQPQKSKANNTQQVVFVNNKIVNTNINIITKPANGKFNIQVNSNPTANQKTTKNSRLLQQVKNNNIIPYTAVNNNTKAQIKTSDTYTTTVVNNTAATSKNKKQKNNTNLKQSKTKSDNITNVTSNKVVHIGIEDVEQKAFESGNKLYTTIQTITSNELKKTSTVCINKAPLRSSPDCPTVEKNTAGNKKYISIYASPDFVTKKYSDTGSSTFLNKRKESTQIISAFSAGVNYTNVFANGVSISAGLHYSQINEKFSFVQSNIVQLTYTINPTTGDTISISSITGTRYKTTINRYRTIDMPLLIGYEMGNTNWHVNVHAGAVVNMYSWQKGDALDVNLKPISITTGVATDAYKYKTNIGVGIMVGASIFYKLNEKLHLMAAPFYRYNFSPISNATLSLQEKFSTIGVKLGLRIDL